MATNNAPAILYGVLDIATEKGEKVDLFTAVSNPPIQPFGSQLPPMYQGWASIRKTPEGGYETVINYYFLDPKTGGLDTTESALEFTPEIEALPNFPIFRTTTLKETFIYLAEKGFIYLTPKNTYRFYLISEANADPQGAMDKTIRMFNKVVQGLRRLINVPGRELPLKEYLSKIDEELPFGPENWEDIETVRDTLPGRLNDAIPAI